MKFSNIQSTMALVAKGIPQLVGNLSTTKVGLQKTTADFPVGTHIVHRTIEALSADRYVTLDFGTTGFLGSSEIGDQAARAQVETTNASGTITGAGTINITVTSAAIPSSPVVVPIQVKVGDTAAVWAGKARAALARNKAITEHFTVGGTSAAIVLTRKIDLFGVANDSTLNIAYAQTTATGVTAAPSSVNTTSGLAFIGYQIENGGTTKDAEGLPNPTFDETLALVINVQRGELTVQDNDPEDEESTPTFLATTTTGIAIVRPVFSGTSLYFRNTGSTTISAEVGWVYLPA